MRSKIYMLMMLPIMGMANGFTIGDIVWHDTNQNWEQDHGELGIEGVKVKLFTDKGKRLKTTTTDRNGKYHFYGVKEGDYIVQVEAPNGVANVTNAKLELWLDKNRNDIDFGLYSKKHTGDFTLGSTVWHDSNQNWEQDHEEQGIEDIRVHLYKASGEKVSTTKTGYKGSYKFKELAEGDYVVKVEVPAGMTAITNTKLEVWLDKSRNDKNFGLYDTKHKGDFYIGKFVWLDRNENWIKDKNEEGVKDVTVNLRKASGEKIATTKTDSNGVYRFDELVEGDYIVKIELPEGMTAVTNTQLEVWLDKSRANMNFGVYKKGIVPPPPPPPPANGEPITRTQLDKMIANGEDVTKVNTSKITDMSKLFFKNGTFNQDISGWDVSNVTNMNSMFASTRSFNQPIGNWNVSNVTNMNSMFAYAPVFNQPIGNWDVSKVKNMYRMFKEAKVFNQSLNSWNVSSVTNMHRMFFDAKVFNGKINNWDVSNVTTMEEMFGFARAFNQPIGSWNTSKVTNMHTLFWNATSFNQPIGNWDVSNVIRMGAIFKNATSFNQPIGSWDVSNAIYMTGMFHDARSFNQPIGNWDVSNVTIMVGMFDSAIAFNQPINNWNVSNVTKWKNIFQDATAMETKNKPEKFR